MRATYPLAALLLVATLLPACEPLAFQGVTEEVLPVTHEAVLAYQFTANDTLGAAQTGALRDALAAFRLTHSDVVVVAVPPSGRVGGTAQRGRELAQLFANLPAQLHIIQDATAPIGRQGIMRIIRVTGARMSCRPNAPGCATSANLAAMLAAPSDLFLPQLDHRYRPALSTSTSTFPAAGAAP